MLNWLFGKDEEDKELDAREAKLDASIAALEQRQSQLIKEVEEKKEIVDKLQKSINRKRN